LKTRSTFALRFLLLALGALACLTVAIGPARAADSILSVDNGICNTSTRSSTKFANLFEFSGSYTLMSVLVHDNFIGPEAPPGAVTLTLWAYVSGSGLPGGVIWEREVTLSNQGSGWEQYNVPYTTPFDTGDKVFAGLQLGDNGFAPLDTADYSGNPELGKSYYFDSDNTWKLTGGSVSIPNGLMVRLDDTPVPTTPEPASIVLLGASCGMFGLLRRRKTKR